MYTVVYIFTTHLDYGLGHLTIKYTYILVVLKILNKNIFLSLSLSFLSYNLKSYFFVLDCVSFLYRFSQTVRNGEFADSTS